MDLASLPGPPGFLNCFWFQVVGGRISGADIAAWPYSVGILIRFTSFLNTLHWPKFGHFGMSFWELLILFEQWAGQRLLSEKVTWPHVRANRPILIPSVPVTEGIEIRHGFQFLGCLGHAEDVDVLQGRVRLEDQMGIAEADTAADLCRRHQSEVLIDARRRLLEARSHWYPIMFDLHRFMITIARVSVNHDGRGGTAPDPLVWDQGSRPKARKIAFRENVDLASLPGPLGFLNCSWFQVVGGRISGAEKAAWPYSVGILIKFASFFGYLALAYWW